MRPLEPRGEIVGSFFFPEQDVPEVKTRELCFSAEKGLGGAGNHWWEKSEGIALMHDVCSAV